MAEQLTGGKAQGARGAHPEEATWSRGAPGHSSSPGAALRWDNLICGALGSESGLSISSAPGSGKPPAREGPWLCNLCVPDAPSPTQLLGVTFPAWSQPPLPILTLNDCVSSITTRSWWEGIPAVGAVIHPLRPMAPTALGNAFSEIGDARRETQHVPNQGVWQETRLVPKLAHG